MYAGRPMERSKGEWHFSRSSVEESEAAHSTATLFLVNFDALSERLNEWVNNTFGCMVGGVSLETCSGLWLLPVFLFEILWQISMSGYKIQKMLNKDISFWWLNLNHPRVTWNWIPKATPLRKCITVFFVFCLNHMHKPKQECHNDLPLLQFFC